MSGTPGVLLADAWACARAAGERAGVEVTEIGEGAPPAFEDTSLLLQRVWQADHPAEIAAPGLLRTYAHSGNYVAGAYRGERLVGAAVGFFGRDETGVPHLHSFVAGVEPGGLGRGVGFALKQHQRAWTLSRDVTEVRWTYDPLVLRNAYFNLCKLGGRAVRYLPEFYGAMADGINSGDLSDRLLLVWRLDAPEAVAAAHGTSARVDIAGAAMLLDRAADGAAVSVPDVVPGQRLLVAVPTDVEDLRRHDPAAATAWRLAVRGAMAGRLAAGWRVAGVSRDGYYLLTKEA
ncbi:GNAT family N-acetyltransferase [Dactylosporangium sp. NBC_01737]|uniref:GNAT family N-acetyltransferase n=1 Tax=Dactylosporangium sp. NBC_01737 TaxID=2975959 RepID=UPI002E1301FC|nr:GNAT family N-acetyltransferase [Dactylosporangium sp. NBC_01737]